MKNLPQLFEIIYDNLMNFSGWPNNKQYVWENETGYFFIEHLHQPLQNNDQFDKIMSK